jgi:large subunit ribosomal protein L23
MKPREIILRPLITEKTTMMQERENTVCFEVDRRANKIQVRKAVEEIFDVQGQADFAPRPRGKPPFGRTQGVRKAGPGFEDTRVLRGHLRRPGWAIDGTNRPRRVAGS